MCGDSPEYNVREVVPLSLTAALGILQRVRDLLTVSSEGVEVSQLTGFINPVPPRQVHKYLSCVLPHGCNIVKHILMFEDVRDQVSPTPRTF